ncbi:MAG: hypothetical protein HKUEN07_18150 [Rhodocyclaceae bacterium]|uniref:PAS domain S-box protein n=1 Tax=Candidatus Desulfobacillus denitrificans TaxID=2608985 RepID=A0A809QZ62_9PROT|nr:PAS domain S-box protein [Candidatus Desulfobacillus denitrificans]GIK44278.1 MAG: hypothetical protein BroJett012_01810 [Betaproteobacteria bacterium]GJQ55246.1 MAG: hypothetical protein HKUEN07_18150 [Rhodocyclaceae bacterium]
MHKVRLSRPARIALGYITVAVLWIFTSDGLVAYLAADQATLVNIQAWKGAAFVLVTGLALFSLLSIPQSMADPRPRTHSGRLPGVLLALTFFTLTIVIVAFGTLVHRYQTSVFKAHQYKQQVAIAKLKANQIERWIDWHRQLAEQLASDPSVLAAAVRHADRNDDEQLRELRLHFESLLKSGRWTEIGLYTPDGHPLARAGTELFIDEFHRRAIAAAASAGTFRLFDMHAMHEKKSKIPLHIAFLAPIVADTEGSRVVGVLALSVDPRQSLFGMAREWPIPSESSETLLVRREGEEVVFMTPLRHSDARPLGLRRSLSEKSLPAVQAVLNGEGVFEGVDYRGTAALAAFRPVAGTDWRIVAKTDTEEVMHPLRQQSQLILLAILLAIGIAGLMVALVWRRRQTDFAKRQDQELAEHEALSRRYVALFQNARDSIFLLDASGRVMEANRVAMSSYGYSDAEIRLLNMRDLRAPETRATFERDYRDAERPEGNQFETLHQGKDGSVFPVEVSTRVIEVAGQRLWQSFVRNIAERKRIETTIRQQLDDLRRWYEVTLDREDRVGELKTEVNGLLQRLGEPPRYTSVGAESKPAAPSDT